MTQTLTAPFTADQLRSADLNTTALLFRNGIPMTFAASLAFGLASHEGDYEGFAAYLNELDAEHAGERG